MKKMFLLTFATFLSVYATNAQIITAVAGNGACGYTGDGGLAIAAEISIENCGSCPTYNGIAFDASGNYYFSDEYNHVIRKVNTAGIITTIAGTGNDSGPGPLCMETGFYSGDGGQATAADLNRPGPLVVDAAGNVIFCDVLNNRVRKISTSGIITTIAGTGSLGITGDGGPATAADLEEPHGIAIDAAGNIFVSSSGYIKKITTSGIITNYMGDPVGSGGDFVPATSALNDGGRGLAISPSGELYLCYNNYIRKINSSGIISTVAGNGMWTPFGGDGVVATSTTVGDPLDIGFDAAGNYYITEGDYRIRKVNTAGIINTIAGTGVYGYSGEGGAATAAQIGRVTAIAVNATGDIYFPDPTTGHRIRRVRMSALHVGQAGIGTFKIQMYPNPNGGSFNLTIASAANAEVPVTITNVVGKIVMELAVNTNSSKEISLDAPAGIYFLRSGDTVVKLIKN